MIKWILLLGLFIAAAVAMTAYTGYISWGKSNPTGQGKIDTDEGRLPADLAKATKQTSLTFWSAALFLCGGVVAGILSLDETCGIKPLYTLGIILIICGVIMIVCNMLCLSKRSKLRKKYGISQTI